ncbi:2-hydroxy-3-keto-5-methylthiopentenyl-1-phosphate phosphatase [Geitlerinema sp. P-1104]|uniref:HAD-IB family phosphatase n=1 Tax=Geitlerinema sp. P-1104 TaxID=2546230 RepID=UPI001476E31B|nr:HAD-IB family phosphatase [Geitlerinema sp. P-1104]NMG56956.1 2-hydroxy-3-keto-5-methylthiopentenyl-1-phosphate phosphatase [Geitlerinema sp. P-1104]
MSPIVFCDFDGTITLEDTFVSTVERFAPEVASRVLPQIYDLRLSLQEGVHQMLEAIPSACYPDIIKLAATYQIRPGFVELLDFLDERNVPLVVVSGGIQAVVEGVLGELGQRVQAIHAVQLQTQGTYCSPYSAFEGEGEMVNKLAVVEHYGEPDWILIGDSITDLKAALAAPRVFARDRLCRYLSERGVSYEPFETFTQVRDRLSQVWT